jgi:hypothetical protein
MNAHDQAMQLIGEDRMQILRQHGLLVVAEMDYRAGFVKVCAWCMKAGRLTLIERPALSTGICDECLKAKEHLNGQG